MFFRTGNMVLPVSEIAGIYVDEKNGEATVTRKSGSVVTLNLSYAETILVGFTASSGWELITGIMPDKDHPKWEAFADPIIGWGLTLFGEIAPVTAGEMSPVTMHGKVGLRRHGLPEIYIPFDQTFANEEAWLESFNKPEN